MQGQHVHQGSVWTEIFNSDVFIKTAIAINSLCSRTWIPSTGGSVATLPSSGQERPLARGAHPSDPYREGN